MLSTAILLGWWPFIQRLEGFSSLAPSLIGSSRGQVSVHIFALRANPPEDVWWMGFLLIVLTSSKSVRIWPDWHLISWMCSLQQFSIMQKESFRENKELWKERAKGGRAGITKLINFYFFVCFLLWYAVRNKLTSQQLNCSPLGTPLSAISCQLPRSFPPIL